MIQIFVFGASFAYGVGARSGWSDLLKQKLHEKMYSENGLGEKYELFNFAKPGEPVLFVLETFIEQIKKYKRDGKSFALISVGGNNTKAKDSPDNFVSTPEKYKEEMFSLLQAMKEHFDKVIFVGVGSVDESKTNPKISPLDGERSYFTNKRRKEFESVLHKVCLDTDVVFIPVELNQEEWISKYQYKDGLHPNQAGHQFIADRIWTEIEPLLDK